MNTGEWVAKRRRVNDTDKTPPAAQWRRATLSAYRRIMVRSAQAGANAAGCGAA